MLVDFTQKSFYQAFDDIYDYEFKVSIRRLSKKLDWLLLEGDKEVQTLVQDTKAFLVTSFRCNGDIRQLAHLLEKLDSLLATVIELAGLSGGYCATPESIQRLILDLLGGLGIKLYQHLSAWNPQTSFYGSEVDAALCDLARINLFFHRIKPCKI